MMMFEVAKSCASHGVWNWPAVSKCHAQNAQDPGSSYYGFAFLLMLPDGGIFVCILTKSLEKSVVSRGQQLCNSHCIFDDTTLSTYCNGFKL